MSGPDRGRTVLLGRCEPGRSTSASWRANEKDHREGDRDGGGRDPWSDRRAAREERGRPGRCTRADRRAAHRGRIDRAHRRALRQHPKDREPRGGGMKIFYGWVIVGAAMIITCIGYGAMFSLGVFLQPIAVAEGWSRTGISTAALLNFLCMGLGSLVWGALSDRFGTRAVVLAGGVLLGGGTVLASQASSLVGFQLFFGVMVGFSSGSLFSPLTATTTRWFTQNR